MARNLDLTPLTSNLCDLSTQSRPQPPPKQPPGFDIAFGHLDDEHIPFPRTSGGRFCANGKETSFLAKSMYPLCMSSLVPRSPRPGLSCSHGEKSPIFYTAVILNVGKEAWIRDWCTSAFSTDLDFLNLENVRHQPNLSLSAPLAAILGRISRGSLPLNLPINFWGTL